jgi:hypothetical protein
MKQTKQTNIPLRPIALAIALAFSGAAMAAAEGEWDGSNDTAWGTDSNWYGDTLPTSTTDVVIDGAASNQPVIDGTEEAENSVTNSVEITGGTNDASLTVENSGSLTVVGEGGITLTGDNDKSATLTIDGENAAVTIDEGGDLTATAGDGSGEDVTIEVTEGTLTVSMGDVSVTGTENGTATLTVGTVGKMEVTDGDLTLTGTTTSFDGTVRIGGDATVEGGTSVEGALTVGGTSDQAKVTVGGDLNVTASGSNATVTVTSGLLTVQDAIEVSTTDTGDASLSIATTGEIIADALELTGSTGKATATVEGTLRVGVLP